MLLVNQQPQIGKGALKLTLVYISAYATSTAIAKLRYLFTRTGVRYCISLSVLFITLTSISKWSFCQAQIIQSVRMQWHSQRLTASRATVAEVLRSV